MSDNHAYLRANSGRNLQVHADLTVLMLKGAGYAAVFCLVIWFGIAALYSVGQMLPEESRETSDPTPVF